MIVLNKEQEYAWQNIVSYALNLPIESLFAEPIAEQDIKDEHKSFDFAMLEGYAGTGKTTTVNSIVKTVLQYAPKKYTIGVTATTHKAVKVLKTYSEFQDFVEFGTIHSICGLKQDINTMTGEVKFIPEKNGKNAPKISQLNLLIVDEVSMLNEDLFKFIIAFQKQFGFKILFIGDSNQIPPVKEAKCVVFNPLLQRKHKIAVFKLEVVMRQALDNPIIAYATAVRTGESYTGPKDSTIKFLSMEKEPVFEILEKYYLSESYNQDPDYIKVLAYTNKTVNRFNTIIREMIFGKTNLPRILLDDRLIAEKPIMLKSELGWVIVAPTNTELKVVDIAENQREVFLEYFTYGDTSVVVKNSEEAIEYYDQVNEFYKHRLTHHNFEEAPLTITMQKWTSKKSLLFVYACTLAYIDNPEKTFDVKILHESSIVAYNNILNEVKNSALKASEKELKARLWAQFYELQKNYAEVNYDYALTVHKSQGSTYKNCLVHMWDINSNRNAFEKKCLTYVAVTRAKNNLFIVG